MEFGACCKSPLGYSPRPPPPLCSESAGEMEQVETGAEMICDSVGSGASMPLSLLISLQDL